MKLNQDCVRDVLLFLEDSEFDNDYFARELVKKEILESKYSDGDIIYTCKKLLEAGYINGSDVSDMGGSDYLIKDITWSGHEFLDNVRDDGIWKDTKAVASKVGSVSIKLLADIAAKIGAQLIASQLGLS